MNSPFVKAGADAGLTSAQNETLSVLLNMLLPPSADGRMPGAGEMAALIGHLGEAFHHPSGTAGVPRQTGP